MERLLSGTVSWTGVAKFLGSDIGPFQCPAFRTSEAASQHVEVLSPQTLEVNHAPTAVEETRILKESHFRVLTLSNIKSTWNKCVDNFFMIFNL